MVKRNIYLKQLSEQPKITLEKLLLIEEDEDLLEKTCPDTGVQIWPLIRQDMLRAVIFDYFYNSASNTNTEFKKIIFQNLLNLLSIATNYSKPTIKNDIVIHTSGLGNYSNKGMIEDRLVGCFHHIFSSQTTIIQQKPKSHFQLEFQASPVQVDNSAQLLKKISGKIMVRRRHYLIASEVIAVANNRCKKYLNYSLSNVKKEFLVNKLARILATFPWDVDSRTNWFRRNETKLLLKEDASAGGANLAAVIAAKRCHITVAEFQHGLISRGHDTYNVSPKLRDSIKYKEVLPDALLTYGTWWSKQTNLPLQKIAIGNPHLTRERKKISARRTQKKYILILGDGIETDLYLSMARDVAKSTKNNESILFRPHPLERSRLSSSMLPKGVYLDTNETIYESLSQARVVISELSTGLFEAIGITEKILIWETPKSNFAFPQLPFPSFTNIDELKVLINDKYLCETYMQGVDADDIWQPNWEKNYEKYVSSNLS
jgi:hypothetical protein